MAWRATNDPAVRERLEELGIPGLYAARVAEFAAVKDDEVALQYLNDLQNCGHFATLNVLCSLAGRRGVDIDDLFSAAWGWAGNFPELASSLDLTTSLTNPAFPVQQRILLGVALAASAPSSEAVLALDRAASQQSSAEWRAAFEYVRDLANHVEELQP
jgi:hypothetical protein